MTTAPISNTMQPEYVGHYPNQIQTQQGFTAPLMQEQYYSYPPRNQPNNVQVRNRAVFMLVMVGAIISIGLFALTKKADFASQGTSLAASVSNVLGEGESQPAAAPIVASNNGISPVFSPTVQRWANEIVEWSAAFDIDPDMIATIMQIESCGDPQAESWAGAQGLFQVMPFHFETYETMKDPDTNAYRGVKYFSERLAQTGGNVGHAFAGYNGGHVAAGSNWDNWHDETQRYYVWSTGIYNEAKSGSTTSATLAQWMDAGGTSLCNSAAQRLGMQ